MRSAIRLPLAAVAGGGLYLAVHIGLDSLPLPEVQLNQTIAACANHLGETAARATTLPPKCGEDYIDSDYFNSDTVTNNRYNSATGNTATTSKTTYYLPTKEGFLKSYITPPVELHSDESRAGTFGNAVGGIIGLGGIGMILVSTRAKKRRADP